VGAGSETLICCPGGARNYVLRITLDLLELGTSAVHIRHFYCKVLNYGPAFREFRVPRSTIRRRCIIDDPTRTRFQWPPSLFGKVFFDEWLRLLRVYP